MKKYVVAELWNGIEAEKVFDDKEKAIYEAEGEIARMTKHDKKRLEYLEVWEVELTESEWKQFDIEGLIEDNPLSNYVDAIVWEWK